MGFRLTITGIAIFTLGLILVAWSLMSERWIVVFGCLAAIALIQVLVVKNAYLAYVASVRTMKPFMARVNEGLDLNSSVLFYRGFDYGALFYSQRHIPSYATRFTELRRPYFLLMWEEDVKRLLEANHLKILDVSEGRGPAGRHRLVLVEPEQDTPIVDPKGYRASKEDDSSND
jgi:hypothetical protein